MSSQRGAEGEWRPCGICTILNGWIVAMGLKRFIKGKCVLTHAWYQMAIDTINLVLSGRTDFWLIYSFLIEVDFIDVPRRKSGGPINLPGIPKTKKEDIDKEITGLFGEGGAEYFDESICIQGLQNTKEGHEYEGGGEFLDKRKELAANEWKESKDRKEEKLEREGSDPLPPPSPTSSSSDSKPDSPRLPAAPGGGGPT